MCGDRQPKKNNATLPHPRDVLFLGIMPYTYRYIEDRVALPSTATSSATSSSASDIDTGESTRTSTDYSDDQIKIELPGDFDDIRYPYGTEQHHQQQSSFIRRHPVPCALAAINVSFWIGIHIAYPFPTTIPVFLGAVSSLFAFTVLDWYRVFNSIIASRRRHEQSQCQQQRPSIASITSSRSSNDIPRSPPPYTTYPQSSSANVSRGRKIRLVLSTALLLFFLHLGIVPPAEHVPVLHRSEPWRPEKYFIAANLYNNADVFDGWSKELLKLCDYREFDTRSCCLDLAVVPELTFLQWATTRPSYPSTSPTRMIIPRNSCKTFRKS